MPENQHKQNRQLVPGTVTLPKPDPAEILKQYIEDISNHHYSDVSNAIQRRLFETLSDALDQFDELKRQKYAGIDWIKAEKLDQRVLSDIVMVAFKNAKRELFREHVRQTELPLSIQRPFLTQGTGGGHVYIVDWIYNLIPPSMGAAVAHTYPQPKNKRHLGRYLYATIERSPKFYLDLSNLIYQMTGQRKRKRQLQRYLAIYDKCKIFEAIDLGRAGSLLAVGFLRKHKTNRGGAIYRKYPLATIHSSEKKWLKYGRSLASRKERI